MELLKTYDAPDKSRVRIWRWIAPDTEDEMRLARYLTASLGFDSYRKYVNDQAYWRLYYREALAGHNAPEVIDHLYLAEVDGVFVARVWFAYGIRSGRGNFGNVYTEQEFRRRGLMNELLKPCARDFQDSPARMLCCASGDKFAVQSYLKYGFKLIYGGEVGPLCLCKNDFFAEAEAAFADLSGLSVRPGRLADQFECDKFLKYIPAMLHNPRAHRIGPAAKISEYRIAFQEVLSGNGVVNVVETPRGDVAGYAFALTDDSQCFMDFTVHCDALEGASDLLRRTADEFAARFGTRPMLYVSAADSERAAAVRSAGFFALCAAPDELVIYQ